MMLRSGLFFVLLVIWLGNAWADTKEETGHYTMNGVTFAIPKKALLVKTPEGEVEGSLPILLRWPNLEPAEWKGDQGRVIHVTIKPYKVFQKKIGDKTVVTNSIEVSYQSLAHVFVYGENNQVLAIKADPYFMAHHAMSGLSGYKLPYSGHYTTLRFDFFIEGDDPIHPQHWVVCELGICTSYNKINDNIMATYGFDRELFFAMEYPELKNRITQKIMSLIIN